MGGRRPDPSPPPEVRYRGFEEAVRFLRTNLQFIPADRSLKTIAFTSAEVGAGKSTAITYLATAMVEAGKSVLVIDADMRRPAQDRLLLGRKERVGLSSFLADAKLALTEILAATDRDGLWVVPSGPTPPNPSELLNSQRLNDLLSEVSSKFDYVLIDSPPTLLVADTPIVAGRVDGVVFIVDTTRTRSRAMSNGFQSLASVRARILGAVLNKYRPSRISYYYGYGGYYYTYRYGESDETASASVDGAGPSVNGTRPGILSRIRRSLPRGKR